MKNLIGKTLGQYEIREMIGQGGLAQVFKAYQPSLDRYVALKVLASSLTEEPGFNERFQREAHTVARLNHPNILSVRDFGVQDEYYYLVMRYIDNSRTLRDLMLEKTPRDQLLDYIAQVAEALDYAHQQGLIHRDVKPGNILIDGQWALLADFGLANMTHDPSRLTASGVDRGTPAYMSPEQARGSRVDQRTDIYALGVILYEILTGTIPHDASTPLAILVKRSTEPITPPHIIKPDTPESLEHVVLRSLAMEPDARYSTTADFAEALKKARTDPFYREVSVTPMADATTLAGPQAMMLPRPWSTQLAFTVVVAATAAVVVGLVLFFVVTLTGGENASSSARATVRAETAAAISIISTETPTPILGTETPTPIPPGTPSVLAKTVLEVRRGPGDEYDLLGYLPAGATAEITSRDETGQWWQIKTSLTGAGVGWIRAAGDYSEAANTSAVPIALAPPTPTGSVTSTLEPTIEPMLETTENTDVASTDTLGELDIDYPLRMSPGSSDAVFISVYIPDRLVSLVPMEIARVDISSDAALIAEGTQIVGERNAYLATILVGEIIRVELSSPTFEVESQYPSTQAIDINAIEEPTYWVWTIIAPNSIGTHVLTVQVYLSDDRTPSWFGSLEVEVIEFTPTPVPTSTPADTPLAANTATATPTATVTPTPTPVPFIQTPGGTAFIGATGSIIAVLITGLIGFIVARASFPLIGTKASYRRTLKTLHRNLARLEEKAAKYGLDVPIKLENELESTREKITEIEAKLAELESHDDNS